MSKGAFLTTTDSFWGAEEAGLTPLFLESPALLEGEVLRLAARGYVLIVVTDDLLTGVEEKVRSALRHEAPEAVLLVVPAAGSRGEGHLSALRERFSTALGVDVWKVTARRAGVDI